MTGAAPGTGAGDGADPDPVAAPDPLVTVYWRPGCPYCVALRRGLRRAGLATREVDIWADPTGASFVRSHAGGSETVPTVDVGGTVLVNPSSRTVVDRAAAAGITVSGHLRRWWRPGG